MSYSAMTPVLTAALQVLAERPAGIDLFLQADYDDTNYRGFVRVRLDGDFLAMLHRRLAFCAAEGLTDTNQRMAPAAWLAEPGVLVQNWNLCIDRRSFVFSGRVGTQSFDSISIYVDDLTIKLALAGETSLDLLEDETFGKFSWRGNALIYEEEASVGFVESILHRVPDVAAAQREIDMAARIGGAGGAQPSTPNRAARRRGTSV